MPASNPSSVSTTLAERFPHQAPQEVLIYRRSFLLGNGVGREIKSFDTGREFGPGNLQGAIRFYAWQASRGDDTAASRCSARVAQLPRYPEQPVCIDCGRVPNDMYGLWYDGRCQSCHQRSLYSR